jgi:hypothetical protein
MAKPWTTREQRDCAEAYSQQGLHAAIAVTGRGKCSIISKMSTLGCNSAVNSGQKERQYYAGDIANIFEMISCGLKQSLIAEYYNTTRGAIKSLVFRANKYGFDAYPLRINE